MKKLILILIACLMCLGAQGQRVDFATYDRVFHHGKVSIVCQGQECRLIVGAPSNPRMSLLLGGSPEVAVGNLNRINSIVGSSYVSEAKTARVSTVFCGELFVLTVSGSEPNRTISFRGMDSPVRFVMDLETLGEMKHSILAREN